MLSFPSASLIPDAYNHNMLGYAIRYVPDDTARAIDCSAARNGSSRRTYILLLMFFVCLWHFAVLYLRDASADRREASRHHWKCVNLDNVGTKIGGRPASKNLRATAFLHLGPKSPSSLHRSP